MIQAVIFDWAGTTVDYGCFAPLDVFLEVFKKKGIEVTHEEAREPMGMLKWDHINTMCQMERIAGLWKEKYGRYPEKKDVDMLYADFEPMLFSILRNYTTPIPGVLELVDRLRRAGIKIGSTTGYTAEMMAIVAPEAKKRGYAPDSLVTPTEMPAGRPYPWMCYQNAINLGVFPMKHVIKVGDTTSDIREAVNAGAWAVGVIKGSSELGMTEREVLECDPDLLADRMEAVAKRFKEAGADYVIDSIGELDTLIPKINLRLAQKER
ncbi:phosphonoacetaldehyde hydrolase [Brevibacillus borstelensis]|jgi:phosphonoacetaldehyde hydrolase|uniref:Phosphonoacetaldehyde hydrolase n=1 Tax=Brevibacillus borstelensis AK1 TaxID=1300222 RepID=M8ECV7_9BACL|nr:phosphonoacetaldehyde hydrolase [Brevibacillus borstelensis]EMT53330.1 phosphonoacetaldehyde hydrolase [Brevibacillus borstelensis AK1]MCC0565737.1 phosphonoacetaldehyde hydrolase [Brevibacillus borstelensis]MCM3472526.1 phosphonoacetaldehyde hydrolase [Brevibacillus borstelensis]MCM3593015.1 phosphonoacetaldehyde hydrolase [Brevibacillus borstelensis]MCM3622071.1 phosphonoacetaldehyde hydrolase [Brevibacillus borstelensis]